MFPVFEQPAKGKQGMMNSVLEEEEAEWKKT
jgi:hypothetical protein